MSSRACRGALVALALLLATPGGAAPADNVVTRLRGTVTYGPLTGPVNRPLRGRIAFTETTRVVTARGAAASVALADTSLVEIGENTDVAVAPFGGPDPLDPPQHVLLRSGALRFTIRHPRGPRSRYVFVTPTTLIAVSGTRAYLVVGTDGERLSCVECGRGDVELRLNDAVYAPVSGQTVDVRIVGGLPHAVIVPNAAIGDAAIKQFR